MNLLTNPSFNQGHRHQDNIPEIVVPNGWTLYWIDKESFPGCGSPPAYRPESVVWNIRDAPHHEQEVFFLDGDYCWKIFKANAPVYVAITQVVTGLVPGGTYRFNAQVFPDIVAGYQGGNKQSPGDIWSAEARVGWSAPDTPWPRAQDGAINWAPWFNIHNQNFAFGRYNDIWLEFKAAASTARVWLECKAKWGFENNWFMDAFSLQPVGELPASSEEEPPEDEEPQAGRVYFLLPTTLPDALVEAVTRVACDAQGSLGFSPHDAGAGDLVARHVVAVNPDEIGNGIDQVWYDTYYPAVQFTPVSGIATPEALEARLRELLG